MSKGFVCILHTTRAKLRNAEVKFKPRNIENYLSTHDRPQEPTNSCKKWLSKYLVAKQ